MLDNCPYSFQKCWFIHDRKTEDITENLHDSNIENEKNEYSVMTRKIKDMLEKYDERIQKLENKILQR